MQISKKVRPPPIKGARLRADCENRHSIQSETSASLEASKNAVTIVPPQPQPLQQAFFKVYGLR